MSERHVHEVICDEPDCAKYAPLTEVSGLWQRPAGWHRVDRRDFCSWNCRIAYEWRTEEGRNA